MCNTETNLTVKRRELTEKNKIYWCKHSRKPVKEVETGSSVVYSTRSKTCKYHLEVRVKMYYKSWYQVTVLGHKEEIYRKIFDICGTENWRPFCSEWDQDRYIIYISCVREFSVY